MGYLFVSWCFLTVFISLLSIFLIMWINISLQHCCSFSANVMTLSKVKYFALFYVFFSHTIFNVPCSLLVSVVCFLYDGGYLGKGHFLCLSQYL